MSRAAKWSLILVIFTVGALSILGIAYRMFGNDLERFGQMDNTAVDLPLEEPPPAVPTVVLRAFSPDGALGEDGQSGSPEMVYWFADGTPVVQEFAPPFEWPPPLAVMGPFISIDLGTSVQPVEIELRMFEKVDETGMPSESRFQFWCEQEQTNGQQCRLVRGKDTDNWWVVAPLPDTSERLFISLRGSWHVPYQLRARAATDWPTFEAGWFFSVVRSESANLVALGEVRR